MELVDVPAEPGSVAPLELTAFDQRLERFLDKERIAAGPPVEALGERRDLNTAVLHVERTLDQLSDGPFGQRLQTDAIRGAQRPQRLFGRSQDRIASVLGVIMRA